MNRRLAVLPLLLSLAACGEKERPEPPRNPPPSPAVADRPLPRTPEQEAQVEALLEDLDRLEDGDESADETAAMPRGLREVAPPPHGCALATAAPIRLSAKAGPPAVTADDGLLVVAHYVTDGTNEHVVVLVEEPGASARPVGRIRIEKPRPADSRVPPGLGVVGEHRVGVAWVDRDGALRFAAFGTRPASHPLAPRVVAESVDARFPPAVASIGRHILVAYTVTGETAHVKLASFEGDGAVRTVELTPPSGGASAPTFVRDAARPTLVLVDPRDGFSPILRIGFTDEGEPTAASVVRPVTNLYDPARIAVASGGGDLQIAYTAHGAAAATAIGFVRGAPTAPAPVSLVRPTGYGALWVDAAGSPSGAVFASLVPVGREQGSARSLELRLVDADGLGPALAVGQGVAFPGIARVAPGLYGVAYSTGTAVEAVFARCATLAIPTL
ncbi:MAG: hypothetical protein U0230_26735 [Polyangiales bacterium]